MLSCKRLSIILLSLSLLVGCSLSSLKKGQVQRTPGTQLDDKLIPNLIKKELVKLNPAFRKQRIKIYSHNKIVLIVGQLESPQMQDQIKVTASRLKDIKHLFNRTSIQNKINTLIKINDTWIENKIKTNLYLSKVPYTSEIQIISEDGNIYLMGLLPKAVAQEMISIISTVDGVREIEPLFEYIE